MIDRPSALRSVVGSVLLLLAGLAGLAVATAESSRAAPAALRPAAALRGDDRVVLKSGRELVGELLEARVDSRPGAGGHHVRFRDRERGELELPRTLVRSLVVGDAPPDLFRPLWLDEPDGAPPKSWTRFTAPRGDAPGALEIGIGRFFHAPTRTTLFLVGAVHIADRSYYDALQDVLDSCDVVLFEGVGPKAGDAPPSDAQIARMDALFELQLRLNDALGLTFQKDGLDYQRRFWRNADVDFGSLTGELDARGVALPTDSPLVQGLLKMVLGGLDLAQAGVDPRMRAMLKRQVAAALAMADSMMALQMKGLSEVLLDWRNDAALRVLDEELAEGAAGRWLALFYGAAHLPDFATKLAARGFEFEGATYLPAWRVD